VFDLQSSSFRLRKGPIFTQILLADEINRAPAKTQSALLEAMEERQVNLDGQRIALEQPFMVIATQNPIEYEGTYPLPEAQLDRFLFKVLVPYSPLAAEIEIMRRYHQGFDAHELANTGLAALLPSNVVAAARKVINEVVVEEGVLDYIARLTEASRKSPDISLGGSTRAAVGVLLGSKTYAAIQGRNYVTPDDVKFILPAVFRHRLLLKPEAEIEGLDADAVIRRLFAQVDVPR
jgi:MoxR-like ATPase